MAHPCRPSGPGRCGTPRRRRAAGLQPVCMDSAELLRGRKAVEISHNGAAYRLQATRLGKLILTK